MSEHAHEWTPDAGEPGLYACTGCDDLTKTPNALRERRFLVPETGEVVDEPSLKFFLEQDSSSAEDLDAAVESALHHGTVVLTDLPLTDGVPDPCDADYEAYLKVGVAS